MLPYKLCLKWHSNLGRKGLSLLEFETCCIKKTQLLTTHSGANILKSHSSQGSKELKRMLAL